MWNWIGHAVVPSFHHLCEELDNLGNIVFPGASEYEYFQLIL